MIRLFSILLLAVAYIHAGSIESYAQDSTTPTEWKKVSVCRINFRLPETFKNQYAKGIDSCVAEFRVGKMRLAIDSGSYGGGFTKAETSLNFKEEIVEIDGKKAQVVTYQDTRKKSTRKFVAGFSVVLFESQDKQKQPSVFLIMTIESKREKDLETARQIFQSIRFEPFTPSTVEWSTIRGT